MRCQNCNSDISDSSAVCSNCGTPIKFISDAKTDLNAKNEIPNNKYTDSPENPINPIRAASPENSIRSVQTDTTPNPISPVQSNPPVNYTQPRQPNPPANNSQPRQPNSNGNYTPPEQPVFNETEQKTSKKKSKLLPVLLAVFGIGIIILVISIISSVGKTAQTEPDAFPMPSTSEKNIYEIPSDAVDVTEEMTDDYSYPNNILSRNKDEIIEYFGDQKDAYYRVYRAGYSGLNLRAEGNTNADILKVLQESEIVLVYGIEDGWAFIKTADSRTEKNIYGWCSADFLKYSHDA